MLSILVPNGMEENICAFVAEIEEKLPVNEIIVCTDRYRRGKGWAVREAILHAKGDLIAFIDGDRDIEPRMLLRLLPFLDDFDAVIGSKQVKHSHFSRKMLTHLSRLYIRIFFNLPFDTQTGIKLFRKDSLVRWNSDGFLFDVEILAKMKRNGKKIIEIPVDANVKERMSWRAVWRTFLESLNLMFRL